MRLSTYLLFLFVSLIFLVPLPQYWLGASSFMSGTFIFLLFFCLSCFLFVDTKINVHSYRSIIFFFLILIIHFFITQFVFGEKEDFMRGMGSLIVLLFMTFCGYFFSKAILLIKDSDFNYIVNFVLILFLFSFIGKFIPAIQNFNNVKPILPFNEPSHYTLFLIPFAFYKVFVTTNLRIKIIYLALFAVLGILLVNLTMLVAVLLCAGISFLKDKIVYVFLFIPIIFPFIVNNMGSSYYTERLILSTQNNNLSTLVFIQGWQLAYESVIKTFGLGTGLQQLGYFPLDVEARYVINKMIGKDVNLTDAGLTAPKIISEFGVLGILGLMVYLKQFRTILRRLKNTNHLKIIFAYSIFLSFSIDLFIRGIGYFNPPFFLFITSLFLIFKPTHENNIG